MAESSRRACRRQWVRRLAFRDILRGDAHPRTRYLNVRREAVHHAADWGPYTAHRARVVAQILDETGREAMTAAPRGSPRAA